MFARYDLTISDAAGNVLAGAKVEVRKEVGDWPLAQLKKDRQGIKIQSNPLRTDSTGGIGFYVAGGFYKIVVTSGSEVKVRRFVGNRSSPGF